MPFVLAVYPFCQHLVCTIVYLHPIYIHHRLTMARQFQINNAFGQKKILFVLLHLFPMVLSNSHKLSMIITFSYGSRLFPVNTIPEVPYGCWWFPHGCRCLLLLFSVGYQWLSLFSLLFSVKFITMVITVSCASILAKFINGYHTFAHVPKVQGGFHRLTMIQISKEFSQKKTFVLVLVVFSEFHDRQSVAKI